MVDSSATQLLNEIAMRHRRLQLHRWFFFVYAAAFAILVATTTIYFAAGAAVVGLLGVAALWVVDQRRKTIDLSYSFDSQYAQRHRQLMQAFEAFCSSDRVWMIRSQAVVLNRKYHAGANQSLDRQSIAPRLSLPAYFRSNVKPPMISVGRHTLYLFPDTILVYSGSDVGAVAYGQLKVEVGRTSFIESESVPRDSRQVGQTWQYVNKKGGPDRRFANNRQLPIMEYGVMTWQSGSGLNLMLHTSLVDAGRELQNELQRVARAASVPPCAAGATRTQKPWPKV